MDNSFCLKGARDICDAVGENPKDINNLVKEHGLPAWKRDEKGVWRALPDDLHQWVRALRDRNIGQSMRIAARGSVEEELFE